MADGVPRDVEYECLLLSQRELLAVADENVDTGDAARVIAVADDSAAGGALQFEIAAGVVVMVMGVENVRQPPAETIERRENRPGEGRIDRRAGAADGIARQIHIIVPQHRD